MRRIVLALLVAIAGAVAPTRDVVADELSDPAREAVRDIDELLADVAQTLGEKGLQETSGDRIALGLLRSKLSDLAAELDSKAQELDSIESDLSWRETELETLEANAEHQADVYEGRLEALVKRIESAKRLIKDWERQEPKGGSVDAWNAWLEHYRELEDRHDRLVAQYNTLLFEAKDALSRFDEKIARQSAEYDRRYDRYERLTTTYNDRLATLERLLDEADVRILCVLDVLERDEGPRGGGTVAPPVSRFEYERARREVNEIDVRIATHERVLAAITVHAQALGKERSDFAVLRAAATEVSLAAAIEALGIEKRLRAARSVSGLKPHLTPERVREVEAAAKLIELCARAGELGVGVAEQARSASWSGLARELAAFVADVAPGLHPVVGAADRTIDLAERALRWQVAVEGIRHLSEAMDAQDYAAMVHSRKLADLRDRRALHQRTIDLFELAPRQGR